MIYAEEQQNSWIDRRSVYSMWFIYCGRSFNQAEFIKVRGLKQRGIHRKKNKYKIIFPILSH